MKSVDMNTESRLRVCEKDGGGVGGGCMCCIHLQNCRTTNLTSTKRTGLLRRLLALMNWA